MQVRLPVVVVGGGLTAIDTATESLAYYPVQVEKFLTRYEALVAEQGREAVESAWSFEEAAIAQEFLTHARALRVERATAERAGRPARVAQLLHEWGGVTIAYRRRLIDSPSYTLNHEEVEKALEEGIRFFVTSLGNPRWVVEKAHAAGGFVYHDVTDRRWAEKGLAAGVDGLIAVNDRAGGHAGPQSAERLWAELHDLGVPLVCAGGVGDEAAFVHALRMGYAGVQMGTRFIATAECTAPAEYKQAILAAGEEDIVLTERLTGVPVSVIRTPHIEKMGTKAGPIGRLMLRGRKTKHWMRMIYSLQSLWKLKRSVRGGFSYRDYLQAVSAPG